MTKCWKWILKYLCFFIVGVLVGRFCGGIRQEQAEEIAEIQDAPRIEEYSVEDSEETKDLYTEENTAYELTEEERVFLEEHLFGQWRFAERIVSIDEDNNIVYGVTPNISDMGMEELKRDVLILYEEDSVQFPIEINQNSFTYAQDMYLFAAYGGFCWADNPVYIISSMDSDVLTLKDAFNTWWEYPIQVEGMENFIHVKYTVLSGSRDGKILGNVFTLFGSDIYIDPNDFNSIYIDFCGLWRMERDNLYYGGNGKSEI